MTLREVGLATRLKSPVGEAEATVTLTVAVWVSPPPLPLTVTVYVPAVDEATVKLVLG